MNCVGMAERIEQVFFFELGRGHTMLEGSGISQVCRRCSAEVLSSLDQCYSGGLGPTKVRTLYIISLPQTQHTRCLAIFFGFPYTIMSKSNSAHNDRRQF